MIKCVSQLFGFKISSKSIRPVHFLAQQRCVDNCRSTNVSEELGMTKPEIVSHVVHLHKSFMKLSEYGGSAIRRSLFKAGSLCTSAHVLTGSPGQPQPDMVWIFWAEEWKLASLSWGNEGADGRSFHIHGKIFPSLSLSLFFILFVLYLPLSFLSIL